MDSYAVLLSYAVGKQLCEEKNEHISNTFLFVLLTNGLHSGIIHIHHWLSKHGFRKHNY